MPSWKVMIVALCALTADRASDHHLILLDMQDLLVMYSLSQAKQSEDRSCSRMAPAQTLP